jgi:transposase-like protein/ribosomal protein S27AE
MIRLFIGLCKAFYESLSDEAIFLEATGGFRPFDQKCPRCGAAGKLSPYGSYFRGLVSLAGEEIDDRRVSPLRFKCGSCGATHALLPDILIPYSPYSLRFKLSVLIAYFERDTTVAAVCERFGIAVSTLYEWKKLLLEHKDLMLGVLASRKTDALAFLRGLFESSRLSSRIRDFFRRHAVSFLQNQSMATTRSIPP